MNGKLMRYLIVIILASVVLFSNCEPSKERNKISFKSPINQISDTITFLNGYLSNYGEVNYYLDEYNLLRIDNNEIGILDTAFLNLKNLEVKGFTKTDQQIFQTILLLNRNGINSCFRHRNLGFIVYDYKPTIENEFTDIRYIVCSKSSLEEFSDRIEGYAYVLDYQEDLYLIGLID